MIVETGHSLIVVERPFASRADVRSGSNCDVTERRGHFRFDTDSGRMIPGSLRSELRIMRYKLSDQECGVIGPMLPNKPRGVPRVDDRRVLNAIFWALRSGAPWRDLPESCRPHSGIQLRRLRSLRARPAKEARPQATRKRSVLLMRKAAAPKQRASCEGVVESPDESRYSCQTEEMRA